MTAQVIGSRMVSIRERLPCLFSVYTYLCSFGMPERFQFDYSQMRSGLFGLIGLWLTVCASAAALTPARAERSLANVQTEMTHAAETKRPRQL